MDAQLTVLETTGAKVRIVWAFIQGFLAGFLVWTAMTFLK
jgi:hypothetical protein